MHYRVAEPQPDADYRHRHPPLMRLRALPGIRLEAASPVRQAVFVGLTTSPDGKSLLYTQIDQEVSDLILVDGVVERNK